MRRPPTSPTRSSVGCEQRTTSGARWPTSSASSEPIRYLALGDSYTIGTGASSATHSWPAIVGHRLTEHTGREVEVSNPSVNGFTTLDLIEKELPYLQLIKPHLVTILIGVNDLVRGRTASDYRGSLATIYDEVARLKLPPGRTLAISIPNWSVVPAARQYGATEEIRELTDSFNDVARAEADARRFTWVDITTTSISGLGSAGWISSDDLHPGDNQYAAWAEVIWRSVRPAFSS